MSKKGLVINLAASLLAFVVQLGINFILTPIIVNKLGDEAYGFIGLANNFTTYTAIFTIAINSMANRFVTIEYYKGNIKEANCYYSSVFFANIILSMIIVFFSMIILINISNLINIPVQLLFDVKLTFCLVVINIIISLFSTIYTISLFVKNRLDISSVRTIIGNLLKVIILLGLFIFFQPKIYYISIAAIVYSMYVLIANIVISRKLINELKISKKQFSINNVKKLLFSGIWNSINSLSTTLMVGLDLLITNIFLGATMMGILSISKIIPLALESFLSTIGNVFFPRFTILYSDKDNTPLINEVNFSIRVLSLIVIVPVIGFIIFGMDFYSLWLCQKNLNEIELIYNLSIIAIVPFAFSSCIYSLHYLDNVTNKLKRAVVVNLIMSIASTITMFLLLHFTKFGVYSIVLSSTIFWALKILIFTPINAAYNLKVKYITFYIPFLKAISCMILVFLIFFAGYQFIAISTWIDFVLYVSLFGIIGYLISFLFLFSKKEKKKIITIVLKKINIKKLRRISVCFLFFIISIGFFITTNRNKIHKYIHISVDDTIDIFKDLNSNNYKSIFDNQTLNMFRKLHKNYGVIVTFFVYYQDENFSLENMTDQYSNEFSNNSSWLKFGFHSNKYNTNYDEIAVDVALKQYKKADAQLNRILGGNKSIDKVLRLNYFSGSYSLLSRLTTKEYGVLGFLASDDNRNSYYLSKEESRQLFNSDKLTFDNINFFSTDFRLENNDNLAKLLENYINDKDYMKKRNILIVFTHEWALSQEITKKNLKIVVDFARKNNYKYEFPMNLLDTN